MQYNLVPTWICGGYHDEQSQWDHCTQRVHPPPLLSYLDCVCGRKLLPNLGTPSHLQFTVYSINITRSATKERPTMYHTVLDHALLNTNWVQESDITNWMILLAWWSISSWDYINSQTQPPDGLQRIYLFSSTNSTISTPSPPPGWYQRLDYTPAESCVCLAGVWAWFVYCYYIY